MESLRIIRDLLCDEIDKIAQAGKIGSERELDQIDKITHALKSIDAVMREEYSGYSERWSYARGRDGRTGRYMSRDDGMGGNGYPPGR